MAENYQELKRLGICVVCKEVDSEEEQIRCRKCADSEYERKYGHKRQAA